MTAPKFLDLTDADGSGSLGRQTILWSSFVFLLVAAAFVVRLWGLSKMHYWDEAVYLQNAEVICCGKTNYSELISRPPLLSLFFAFVFLFWHHIYAACIATALVNALGAALLFAAGRKIAGPIPAAIASLLLAFLPFMVGIIPAGFQWDNTGNSLLSDCPALTLILLAFWLLLRALKKETSLRFASAGFVMALAVLMRFPSLASVGMISLLALMAQRRLRAVAACAIGFAIGFAPYLIWSRIAYGGFLATLLSGWDNFDGPEESPLFFLRNFTRIFGWITVAGLALWIGSRAWEWWKRKASRGCDNPAQPAVETPLRRLEGFLWLWAAGVLLCFSALSHKEPRYILPLAPPLFLLAGGGLSVLVEGRRGALRIAGSVLLAGALACAFLPTIHLFGTPFLDDKVTDQMEASDFLTKNLAPSAVLYTKVDYPVFAYYTRLKVVPIFGTGDDVNDTLDHLPEDGVFIAYKENDTDGDGPRLSWLDANPHFRRLREYPSIVLYSYRAGEPQGKPPL
ncbi:MAG: glycosyltransferase family 39 protein [Terracidiphilus sp.]|jgi:4-amino-4-deoxy-L-arabinose transferase-like glycosyltransferase